MTFIRKLSGPGAQITMPFAQKLPGYVSTQKIPHVIFTTSLHAQDIQPVGIWETTRQLEKYKKTQEEKCFFGSYESEKG